MTKKQIADKRDESFYFIVKGVKFKLVGTRQNKNGSWTSTIKNVEKKTFKDIGYDDLQNIINR